MELSELHRRFKEENEEFYESLLALPGVEKEDISLRADAPSGRVKFIIDIGEKAAEYEP